MVYGAALEKRCPSDGAVGSNPTLSAIARRAGPLNRGEVLEWSIRRAWKARAPAMGPWVRIPPSPPRF